MNDELLPKSNDFKADHNQVIIKDFELKAGHQLYKIAVWMLKLIMLINS